MLYTDCGFVQERKYQLVSWVTSFKDIDILKVGGKLTEVQVGGIVVRALRGYTARPLFYAWHGDFTDHGVCHGNTTDNSTTRTASKARVNALPMIAV